jgi:ribonuclease J
METPERKPRRRRRRRPQEGASLPQGASDPVEIIPLGGMGEIGKNITVFRYRDEMFVLDGGLAFPEEGMPGVDLLIPRVDFLIENRQRIKAWVLTHGHEDHIGGLPFILPMVFGKESQVPIYGARLTLGLLKGKLEEFGLRPGSFNLKEISPDDRIQVGRYFTLDLFRMTHSIPDNSGLVIRTPIGTIVHTGDFKLDATPIDGQVSHLAKVAQAGAEGVLLLIADSTNAERPGYTPSEMEIAKELDRVIGRAPGRVFVTTFASHIHRIQSVIWAAEKYGRKVAMEGRSMVKFSRIAMELGYLKVKDRLYALEEVMDLPDHQVLILATGSQGQPMSVLHRLAFEGHSRMAIKPGDTVILSSSPIPGNEEAVNRVINRLYALGAYVLYPPTYKVHASGHASQEELKLILNLTTPRFFLPWHGEVRHQTNFKWLAESMSRPPEKTLIGENGAIYRLTPHTFEKVGTVPHGALYVDGLGVGDITEEILADRRHMAEEGLVVITALAGEDPVVEVVSRGFVKAGEKLLGEVRRMALEALLAGIREKKPLERIRDDIYYPVKKFLKKATGRDPMILPVVIEG